MTLVRSIVKLITSNGLGCYLMIKKKNVSITNFTKAMENNDIDSIKEWIKKYPVTNISYYEKKYTKVNCIDEVLEYSYDKYHHLREIRDVVRMEPIADKIIDDKTYKRALSVYYSFQIFNLIFKNHANMVPSYLPFIKKEQEELFQLIMREIDSYYINIITK